MRFERPLLLLVLLVAAGLRFTGIAHHVVRGAADFDEQNNFLRPIERMAREGTPDPTVYQGYAGLFNWLAAGPVLAGRAAYGYAGMAVGARGVVAAFGVLNVLLAWALARRLAGPAAGLFAAGLLAVSRLDVRAAHHVTPDVLVGTAVLAVLLLVAREARGEAVSARRDLLIGVITGLATAIKFNGAMAGIPGAAAALLSGGFVKRGLRMGLAALLAFGLGAPYAVSALVERGGKLTGLKHYYGEKAESNQEARGGEGGLAAASRGLSGSVGPVACLLALLAPFVAHPRRALVPALVVLGASVAVLAPAAFVYPRHLVPPAIVMAVLAGAGFGAVVARLGHPAMAWILVAASLPFQARESLALVARDARPAALDHAAEWIEASVSRPALVLSALPRLAIDRTRFELRRTPRLADVAPAVAAQYDLLVTDITSDAAAMQGFAVLARFPSEEGVAERTLSVLGPALRPTLVRVEPARVTRDGAVEIDFAAPSLVFRVEAEADDWPRETRVEARGPSGEFSRVHAEPLRPTERDRRRDGARGGQIFILPGDPIAGLRISAERPGAWTRAELRVFALADDAILPEAMPVEKRDRRRQRRR